MLLRVASKSTSVASIAWVLAYLGYTQEERTLVLKSTACKIRQENLQRAHLAHTCR